jgi:putative YhbY family RNA-binding protein
MPQLTSAQVRELRARAHGLDPVVSIAENGLSESVLKEIDTCLKAHELIKIRVYGDSRENRLGYLATICQELGAAAVQHIGKLLVVYRENPEKPAPARKKPAPQKAPARRSKRSFQG